MNIRKQLDELRKVATPLQPVLNELLNNLKTQSKYQAQGMIDVKNNLINAIEQYLEQEQISISEMSLGSSQTLQEKLGE